MKTLIHFILSFAVIYVLASCAGSRKIDFDSAYKFNTYNYQKSSNKDEAFSTTDPQRTELMASIESEVSPEITYDISDFEKRMYSKIGVSPEEGREMELEKIQSNFQQLKRKEKREARREVKKELKEINTKTKKAYSTLDAEQVNQISEITRWSIIIGSVGLVLLILGVIFSASLLTFFGAIFVVGAAVLFIIDQI